MAWWIAYDCGVKSETINLHRRVDLRCAWTSVLSEQILSCILEVSLKCTSHVSGYDTTSRYLFDSLSVAGLWEVHCAGSVSGEGRSWQWFDGAINCKWFIIVDSVNIPKCFVTLVSGAPEIDMQQITRIKLASSGTPENTDLVCRFQNYNSSRTIWDEDDQWHQRQQILTQRNIWHHKISLSPPLIWCTCFSSHKGSSK